MKENKKTKKVSGAARWRGFNLIEMAETKMAYPERSVDDFKMDIPEDDFRWISDWGFNAVRVCMNYRVWTQGEGMFSKDEAGLAKIDRIVELGRKYGLHVSLDMHRGPGKWEVPARPTPLNLWKDQTAVDAFAYHWGLLAERYKGISSKHLSFDLLNEPERVGGPEGLTLPWFEKWVRQMVASIRNADNERLIVLEGPCWGREYVPALADLNLAWSFHCWDPISLSHWGTGWEKNEGWPKPTWPMKKPKGGSYPKNDDYFETFDKAGLERHLKTWIDLSKKGIPVYCGETGLYHKSPHKTGLKWLKDLLTVFKENNIGFSVFAVRGTFGVIDSGRTDCKLKDWRGHTLDEELLELLRSS